jgi:predicted phage terminase large subunit-like protein
VKISEADKDIIRVNIARALYKKSFAEYFYKCVQELDPSISWHFGWYHEYLCNIFQREAERIHNKIPKPEVGGDYLISIPPRSSKSLLGSAFISWVWLYYPEQKFIRLSYSDQLASELNYITKKIFELPWYIKLNNSFVLDDKRNTLTRFYNNHMGSVQCAGVKGSYTGFGGDWVWVDDAAKATDIGEKSRLEVIKKFTGEAYNRINSPHVGCRVVVGQRIHQQDLIGFLESNPNYTYISLPAIINGDVKPKELIVEYEKRMGMLIPELFDLRTLEEYRKQLGSYSYSAQYLMQPVPVGGGILKYDDFETIQWEDAFKQLTFHLVIDSAFGKQKSDNSAILVAARWNNNLLIKKSYQLNQEFPELIQSIKQIHAEHCNQQSKIFIEGRGSGQSIVQSLRRETRFNVIEIQSGSDDKITRCHAISPVVESKRVFCCDGSYLPNFLDEVCNFPLAAFDDQTDTLIYGIEHILNKNNTVTYINQTNLNDRHQSSRRR